MSTFNGILPEFPHIRIDDFVLRPDNPPPLACFLSHIHTDHLRGLLSFKCPFIYCTATTRSLLLRLEKRSHRLNFASGLLESRVQTYRHLKKLLRPIPLSTPTEIELRPGDTVRVTAVDANHCLGACMFLIEGRGRAVLYTGDLRCEKWWVEGLGRVPALGPYVMGLKRLDKVYLDTSFAGRRGEWYHFEGKDEGVKELMERVMEIEEREGGRTSYYLHAWTVGYENVLVQLAALLGSRVHVDEYRWRLYSSLWEGEGRDVGEAAPLVGFREGNRWQEGCFTRSYGDNVRIHACERGTGCDVLKHENVVQLVPIVTRHKGVEYMETGVGGGHGDLDQVHELELNDLNTIGALVELCQKRLYNRPDVLQKVITWLEESVKQGASNVKLDTEAFYDALEDGSQTRELEEVPIDRLILALERLVSEKKPKAALPAKRITFPYSRHASYEELRFLVAAIQPKAVHPNTFEPGMDMDDLFGDLLSVPDAEGPSKHTCDDRSASRSNAEPVEIVTIDTETDNRPQSPGPPQVRPNTKVVGMEKQDRAKKRKKRCQEDIDEAIERRLSTYEAVLSSHDGHFKGLDLLSVRGYHNQEAEVEL
ncbi:Protein artemis [Sphaceloma murrayae]|uniref:Protein artemis n=1 Tax=Sphaceloma murrayae TaxID=2082308 RepID=A0A2K1R2R3_9PEZI|nr:Protein artemis [Sphaceloma murrayae]